MKPKNKFQKEIARFSHRLPELTKIQKRWAIDNCVQHFGRRLKGSKITCADCGHSWQGEGHLVDTLVPSKCPNCQRELTIKTTRQSLFKQVEYMCVVTRSNGYQVLRFYYVCARFRIGEAAKYDITEVVQRWIAPNGKQAVLALLRPMFSYNDTWVFGSSLELRPDKDLYDILPHRIYPRQLIIPEIKRNGFKGEYHGLTPFEMFHSILNYPQAETLLKSGYNSLLLCFARDSYKREKILRYWSAVRICIRNKYRINEGTLWLDYLDLLTYFGKDTNNPKFVCPDSYRAEHDSLSAKRNRIYERERVENERRWRREQEQRRIEQEKRQLERMAEDERQYKKLKSKYFGVIISDGEISVKVLESVNEFYEEGKAMNHCVFTNNYYLKSNSLVFSARMREERLETVEVSLKDMKVVQCYGVGNTDTQYHKRIIDLVNSNMRQIKKRISA